MESFEYAPWVVLFSILVFVILYGGCILGQQIMKLPETGKDSLILFSTERTFRSLSVCWDYVLLFTRLVSFGYLLAILIYGSLSYEYAINIWYSFRMWNCLFVELFFLFSLANSVFGLFLPEKLRCCLTNSAAPGYYGYAFFMQMLFVISGATSLFIAVVMFWLQDNSTSFLNLSFNVVPMIFMIVEVRCCCFFATNAHDDVTYLTHFLPLPPQMYLDKFYVRFNHYWVNFVYLYFYIFTIWVIVAMDRLYAFPYWCVFCYPRARACPLQRRSDVPPPFSAQADVAGGQHVHPRVLLHHLAQLLHLRAVVAVFRAQSGAAQLHGHAAALGLHRRLGELFFL